jgi:hypothetical protein
MVHFNRIGQALGLAVIAAGLLTAAAARADEIYTVTATGIIDDIGQDYGIFGGPYGNSLIGSPFTVVEVFDITQSTFNQGNQNEDLNPATATAAVTVNGVTVTTSSSGAGNTLYLDSAVHASTFGGSSPFYSQITSPDFYVQLQIFNGSQNVINTLDSIGLDVAYFMTFNSSVTGKIYFQGSDNTYLYGSLLTLRLAPPADREALAAAAPEPGSILLFVTGLFVLARTGKSRRHRPARHIAG